MGSGRARDRTGFRGLVAALAGAVVLAACGGGSDPSAGSPTKARITTPSPAHATTASAPALDCDGASQTRTIWFPAGDGTRLYGALVGSGRVGVVVANDVPHQLCETLTPARFLAAHGYRVLSFDYRDHGLSDRSEAPGRLDLDVAGAVAELRSRGAVKVILLGSYAGVAAAVVAATEISPPVDGVIGISPAAARGQWVQGPFGPISAFEAAPLLRIPVLYITVRTDPYVSVGEVNRLFRLTAGPAKDLMVIPAGSAGFDTIDFNSYEGRVRGAILSFVRRVAPIRPA